MYPAENRAKPPRGPGMRRRKLHSHLPNSSLATGRLVNSVPGRSPLFSETMLEKPTNLRPRFRARPPCFHRQNLARNQQMNSASIAHLTAADPVLGELIAQVGPCALQPDRARAPFEALVQAVAHQQLNGKAANTILTRFKALFPKRKFPSPVQVDAIEVDKILGAGFSRAKAAYVKGIARAALDGLVPSRRKIERMNDDEIIARLTQIKGIGQWSVEMFLMFGLGRPDVLPVNDYGIQQGFAITYRKRQLPKPDQILKQGERWRPYRSTASWYLWRAVDLRNGK